MIDVIGHVADNKNPTLSHLQIIHSMPVHFIGRSDPITKHREPRFNPGKDDASPELQIRGGIEDNSKIIFLNENICCDPS